MPLPTEGGGGPCAVERHQVRAADGVSLCLHRLGPRGAPPVLLSAGTFSTSLFWLGGRGQGFAYELAAAGFDTWILEPRGHGSSERPVDWTIDDWIRFDAPAAAEAVLGETGSSDFVWVGHSAGGVVGAGFAGSEAPSARKLRGLVLLGAPGPAGLRGLRRAAAWSTMLAAGTIPGAHWSGRFLRLGPEREPGRLIRDWMRWNLSGRWRTAAGEDHLSRLHRVQAPVLAVAGAGDAVLAPPIAVQDLLDRFGSQRRGLIVAGREQGFSVDYGHAGLVIGRAARVEIWPRIIDWIARLYSIPSGGQSRTGHDGAGSGADG